MVSEVSIHSGWPHFFRLVMGHNVMMGVRGITRTFRGPEWLSTVRAERKEEREEGQQGRWGEDLEFYFARAGNCWKVLSRGCLDLNPCSKGHFGDCPVENREQRSMTGAGRPIRKQHSHPSERRWPGPGRRRWR